jgi:two-component system cell cycle response regulator
MNKKVLTIDDSKTLRMIIGKHLSPFGVQMMQAENGEEGITRARESVPDVILLDYNMPVMDGYHTLIELKADPDLKEIPVIMLTTETVQETVIKLVKLGLKDYIAKPFTRDVLLKKLNPLLNLYTGDEVPPEKSLMNATAAAATGANSDKPTILAVDDKSNIIELLKEYVGTRCAMITADSGTAAIKAIEQKRFDYLVLDLSLPDVNAFDVLKTYLQSKQNGANVKNVVAMTLRTAQEEIERVMGMGVNVILHKPFTREDTDMVVNRLISSFKKEEMTVKKLRYLAVKGTVRILDCPPEKSSQFRSVATALSTTIKQEIDDMAEEGLSRLVINVGEGFLSDLSITRKFVNLIEHIMRLSLNVRLVANSEQARDSLKQFAETASLPVDTSLETALNSIA